MMWIWFALAVLFIVLEVFTTDLVSVWFAVSALALGVVTGIASDLHIGWQIFIFVLLSGALVLATRPLVKKFLKKKKNTETNLELVLGHKALVVEPIHNDLEQGAVKINGLVWTARSVNGELIEKDTLVIVKNIQGNKVFVEKE